MVKQGGQVKIYNPKGGVKSSGGSWGLFSVTFQKKGDSGYETTGYGSIFVNNIDQFGTLDNGKLVTIEKINSVSDVKIFSGKPQITINVDLVVDTNGNDAVPSNNGSEDVPF